MINPKATPCAEAAIQSVQATGTCAAGDKPWVLVVAILASSIAYIDESVVTIALPAIETELATSVVVIQWIVNAYTLCLSAFLLTGGAAGDLFGRRRVFIVGVAIFAAASLWSGLSPNITELILARAIQGSGAALLIPCSLAIIGANFDEAERGKAIGTWAGFSAIAGAIGPLLGGVIVDHFSWRLIFLINPALAVPTIWLALRHVPESRDVEVKGGLDWCGSILAFLSLGSLVFGLISAPVLGWSNATVVAALLIGAVLLAAFIWQERRSRNPMLPLGLFASRTFTAVNALTLFLYAAIGGAFFFLPFALIQVRGFSAALAGATFLPFTLIMGVLSRWSGGLLDRFGAKWLLVIGPAIAAIGLGLLALPIGGGPYWLFLMPITILGVGMVVSVAPLTTTVINAVPANQTGVAAGINDAVASVANLLAVAMIGALALGVYDRGLDKVLKTGAVTGQARAAVEAARGQFVTGASVASLRGDGQEAAETVIKHSLARSLQVVMLASAALALAGAASSLALPPPPRRPRRNRRAT